MKPFLQTLARHPIAVICYGLYTWLCYFVYSGIARFHNWALANPHKHNLSYGEGVAYSGFFLVIIAMLYGVVLMINIIVSKRFKFYLWLMMIILVQTIVTLNIG